MWSVLNHSSLYRLAGPRWGRRISSAGILLATAFLLSACTQKEVTLAFEGQHDPEKNNRLILEYCQSCHIHKEFSAQEHLPKVRAKYKSPVFNRAEECRVCHFVEKQWVYNEFLRKTRYPYLANRGEFKGFEKEEWKRIKKRMKK